MIVGITTVEITDLSLRHAILETFPGVTVKTTSFLTGVAVEAAIWHFHIKATLTTNPVIYAEKAGEVLLEFSVLPSGSLRAGRILHKVTTNMDDVIAFIRYCRAYLDGIVVAITMAEEVPETASESDADLV